MHEYVCNDCKEEFTVTGSFSSFIGFIPTCPSCKSRNIYKKIFPAGIIFKGKDFYKTRKGETE